MSAHLTPTQRLARIVEILERVDQRCSAVDGPVVRIDQEITETEVRTIFALAKGKP